MKILPALIISNNKLSLILTGITERGDASDHPFTGSAEKLFKSDQNILFQDLFRNYNKEIRPVLSHDQVIEINFEIALFNVLELVSVFVPKRKIN
jgi:hypothetical protein